MIAGPCFEARSAETLRRAARGRTFDLRTQFVHVLHLVGVQRRDQAAPAGLAQHALVAQQQQACCTGWRETPSAWAICSWITRVARRRSGRR